MPMTSSFDLAISFINKTKLTLLKKRILSSLGWNETLENIHNTYKRLLYVAQPEKEDMAGEKCLRL